MDLAGGALFINAPNIAAADPRALLQSSTIFSSLSDDAHRVGYALGSALFSSPIGTHRGEPMDATALVMELTYAGDTNLDGIIDTTDLGHLALSWQIGDGDWSQGDFNYDGRVDVADLRLLAANWNAGSASPAIPISNLLPAMGLPPINVPEPSSAAIVLIGSSLLICAKRRRQG